MIATLDELNDVDALIDILTEPKNALVKQYQKLFEFEDVSLRFTDRRAAMAIARRRSTASRALAAYARSSSSAMLDLMYEIPSRDDVEEVRRQRGCDPSREPSPCSSANRRRRERDNPR